MNSGKYSVSLLVMALPVLIGSCQGKKQVQFDIENVFRAVPKELIFDLSESAIDSLITLGTYIDPVGDEFETVVYEFSTNDSTVVSSTLSFQTGQRGFVTVQIKAFRHRNGDLVVIYSKHGGVPDSFEPHELKRFNYEGGKLIETQLGEVPESIDPMVFYMEGTPESDKEILNVGYELNTENENTFEFFAYSPLMQFGEPNYFSKLTFRWDGEKFVRSGFSD